MGWRVYFYRPVGRNLFLKRSGICSGIGARRNTRVRAWGFYIWFTITDFDFNGLWEKGLTGLQAEDRSKVSILKFLRFNGCKSL